MICLGNKQRSFCHFWDCIPLETNRYHSVIFEIASKYCISDSFHDYEGYSISSKGFLPTLVDIMVLLVIHPIQSNLAISCWTTSNLTWLMVLSFQVPIQYCSLQHRTLQPSTVTSTTGCCFCFDSVPSFFLELFLHWSPLPCWAPTDLGSSSFSVLSFCLFILFIRFSRQEYWSGLPFPSPGHHVFSEVSTMTCLS